MVQVEAVRSISVRREHVQSLARGIDRIRHKAAKGGRYGTHALRYCADSSCSHGSTPRGGQQGQYLQPGVATTTTVGRFSLASGRIHGTDYFRKEKEKPYE